MQKLMKTSDELIKHMKDKGILFNIVDEEQAKEILENRNYYLKLASYRNNYTKNQKDKYIDLEFAYLKELSDIDTKLRYLILQMTLDIEHFIKVEILNDIAENFKNDAYSIVQFFQTNYQEVEIKNKKSSKYCGELIAKYETNIPIWVFLEVISFGDLIKFYNYYINTYSRFNKRNAELLYFVRSIRNAAAHSNCLIYNLKKGIPSSNKNKNSLISNYASHLGISKIARKKLNNPFFMDFTALFYAYKIFIKSERMKKNRREEIKNLFDKRILEKKDYFNKNETLKSAYKFCKIIIDDF